MSDERDDPGEYLVEDDGLDWLPSPWALGLTVVVTTVVVLLVIYIAG